MAVSEQYWSNVTFAYALKPQIVLDSASSSYEMAA
jgi:hypothetical protein